MSDFTLAEVVERLRNSAQRTGADEAAAYLLKTWTDANDYRLTTRDCAYLIENGMPEGTN